MQTQEEREWITSTVRECARAHGVSDDTARRVADGIRPSIRLLSSRAVPPNGVGACRLGGLPDLPVGMAWPTFPNPDYGGREYPYRFLMQIDLAMVRPLDARGLLPEAGHLYFFCHWQDDVEHHSHGWAGDESAVLFAGPDDVLRTVDPPEAVEDFQVYSALALSPAPQWTVPAPCEVGFEPWPDETPWAFFEEVEQRVERVGMFAGERLPKHRLLGYADFIQSPGMGDRTELLAQVDTDPFPGPSPWPPENMLWGDCGRVYYLIEQSDLAAGRFNCAFSLIEMC